MDVFRRCGSLRASGFWWIFDIGVLAKGMCIFFQASLFWVSIVSSSDSIYNFWFHRGLLCLPSILELCNRLGCVGFLKVSEPQLLKDYNKHQDRILHQTGWFMVHVTIYGVLAKPI